jgi:hypothetical protein
MKKAFISINSQAIRRNIKSKKKEPVIRIARSRSDSKPIYASKINISGPSELIYSPTESIMRCGARMVLVANYDDVKIVA